MVVRLTEPGYYEAAKFGIRIENIVQVVPAPEVQFDFNGKGAFKLFDITSVPIQRKLIDLRMLNQREVCIWNAWLSLIKCFPTSQTSFLLFILTN